MMGETKGEFTIQWDKPELKPNLIKLFGDLDIMLKGEPKATFGVKDGEKEYKKSY